MASSLHSGGRARSVKPTTFLVDEMRSAAPTPLHDGVGWQVAPRNRYQSAIDPSQPMLQVGRMRYRDSCMTAYRTLRVQGLDIFYREGGRTDCPHLLLLHGFPSSSRMFERLMPMLSPRYHLVAPDYPGFGHSSAPVPEAFAYTFDRIASVVDAFARRLGMDHFALFVQDYGGPVGFRLAIAHPERISAIVVQNAVAHEEGLGPLWETRRRYWADRNAWAGPLRGNLISPEAARRRHVGTDPRPELYDSDLWADETAFLARPGQAAIQEELFYDYRRNVQAYPVWQSYLREWQPPLLVIWGKYDPSFTEAGAWAYRRDVPDANIHLQEAGHFAMDTRCEEIALITQDFLDRRIARAQDGTDGDGRD
ncbi:alpha/beta hydrolase [Frateuria edaphi]|uniref:alpha/beta fold hydrolase n=1 Tax=Frateuria edaphi TaxID=2898793 RepID=UPI001E33E6B7|nr:alpha/beta hydrolase [Frateuria edaphi]UGB45455.1 alpha/beta hydrolase [Frateuria edaphi]